MNMLKKVSSVMSTSLKFGHLKCEEGDRVTDKDGNLPVLIVMFDKYNGHRFQSVTKVGFHFANEDGVQQQSPQQAHAWAHIEADDGHDSMYQHTCGENGLADNINKLVESKSVPKVVVNRQQKTVQANSFRRN